MQTAPAQHCSSACSFTTYAETKVVWSPTDTFCPEARGLSTQCSWELTPCVSTARSCFPCPLLDVDDRTALIGGLLATTLVPTSFPNISAPSCECQGRQGRCQSSGTQAGGRYCCRGHGESEPRSVGALSNAHGITVMMRKIPTCHCSSARSIDANGELDILQLPAGTLCPKARGLSPQHG